MNLLILFVYLLAVVFRFWLFREVNWLAPLKKGDRYFLDVEVPPGWHASAEGKKWWRRYHASILVPHGLEALAFLWIAVWGTWSQLPLLALVAPVFVVMYTGVIIWWRHSSGVDRVKPKRLVVDLRGRRLSDYFTWKVDGLMLLLAAASWVVLAGSGDGSFTWKAPVILTYLVLGLAVFKADVVRTGWGLPPQRTEDYRRLQDMRRAQAVGVLDRFRWMMLAVLVSYAAVHSVEGILPVQPVRWTAVAASLGVWVWMMVSFAQSERALNRLGADLPPAVMPLDWGRGWWSFGAFLAGLAALLIWFRG